MSDELNRVISEYQIKSDGGRALKEQINYAEVLEARLRRVEDAYQAAYFSAHRTLRIAGTPTGQYRFNYPTMSFAGMAGGRYGGIAPPIIPPPVLPSGGGGGGGGGGSMSSVFWDIYAMIKDVVMGIVGLFKKMATAMKNFVDEAMTQAADYEALVAGLRIFAKDDQETGYRVARLRELSTLPGIDFFTALRTSSQLQGTGLDSRMSERVIKEVGNALAMVGKTDNESFQGVLLAFTQIVTKGGAIGQEIRQIAERLPQIRKLMMDAFGTSRSEEIEKMGIKGADFIAMLLDQMEKLPRAADTAKNFFQNMGETWQMVMVTIGEALNKNVIPMFQKIQDFLGYLSNSGILSGVFDKLFGTMNKLTGGSENKADFGVNIIAQMVALLDVLPNIMEDLVAAFQTGWGAIKNVVLEVSKSLINLANIAIKLNNVAALTPWGAALGMRRLGEMNPDLVDSAMGLAGEPFQNMFRKYRGRVNSKAQEILKAFQASEGVSSTGVLGDTSKGGLLFNTMEQIAQSTEETAKNTRKSLDLQRYAFGGGDIGRFGLTASERQGMSFGTSRPSVLGRGSHGPQALGEIFQNLLEEAFWRGHNAGRRGTSYAGA